jgi:RNA polymerase sigma-70 factor (ECF subfamily)
LSNQRDRQRAAKRGGGQQIVSLEEIKVEQERHFEAASDLTPDKLFDQRWAIAVLDEALKFLQQEMADEGRIAQFEGLKPYLTDDPDEGDYGAIAAKLGVKPKSVAVMVFRLRQRYRELVRAEVAHTLCNPLDVDDEMGNLLKALGPA